MPRARAPQEEARAALRWSKRQREVLDLLAQRKTNGEIAEALGISLDGAKYHVREILTRLDLDTREEAAEWWRQQQGMRARMRIVTRRMRFPIAIKIAGGAAAAAAVVAGILFVVSLASDDDIAALEPGLWVAKTVPVSSPGEGTSRVFELRTVKADGSDRQALGEAPYWGRPAWSPDGQLLAAAYIGEIEGDGNELHIFDVTNGDSTIVDIPAGFRPFAPSWSPDGSRLILYSPPHVLLLDAGGATVASVELDEPANQDAPEGVAMTGSPAWSPDSSRVAVPLGMGLAVLDRDGQLLVTEDRHDWWAIVDEPRTIPILEAWDDDDEILVGVVGGSGSVDELDIWYYHGTVHDDAIEWREEPGDELPRQLSGGIPPDWMREYVPDMNLFSLGSSMSANRFPGSVVIHSDEPGMPAGPTGVADDARAALLFLHGNELQILDIDADAEAIWAASRSGISWDVVHIED